MIRGLSLFITILFLAGSAGATDNGLTHPAYIVLTEPGNIPLGPYLEGGNQIDIGNMVTLFSWTYSNFGPEPVNTSYPRETFDFAPVHDTARSSDQFNFDTIEACASETSTACSDKFWTTLEFGTLSTTIDSGFHAGERERGFQALFDHHLAASDKVLSSGQVVFKVKEDTTYKLDAVYEISGDGIYAATFSLFFYEGVRVEQTDPDNPWSIYEWQRLVSVQQIANEYDNGGPVSDVVFSAPNDGADCQGCPAYYEGASTPGHDFEGILKANKYYRLLWSIQATRTDDAVGDVFPEGKIALVVPEPSSDLMLITGILGIVFLRRRALATKVS